MRPAPSWCDTNERRLYSCSANGTRVRYPVGVGKRRQAMGRRDAMIDGKYVKPGLGAARRRQARKSEHARRHPRRLAEQSDGRRGDDAGRRRIRHPRHQQSELDRRLRVLWLHPDVQQDITDLFERVSVGTPVIVTPR